MDLKICNMGISLRFNTIRKHPLMHHFPYQEGESVNNFIYLEVGSEPWTILDYMVCPIQHWNCRSVSRNCDRKAWYLFIIYLAQCGWRIWSFWVFICWRSLSYFNPCFSFRHRRKANKHLAASLTLPTPLLAQFPQPSHFPARWSASVTFSTHVFYWNPQNFTSYPVSACLQDLFLLLLNNLILLSVIYETSFWYPQTVHHR